MAWDATPSAGFTPPDGTASWLPLSADWRTNNVSARSRDPRSLLNLYRQLLALRRDRLELQLGSFQALDGTPEDVLMYERAYGDGRVVIALNFGDIEEAVSLGAAGTVVLSTTGDRQESVDAWSPIKLEPAEGLIIDCTPDASP
jgi:glycosidase